MNFLISMNKKIHSKYNVDKVMQTILNIDTNKSIKGAEIYINLDDENEKKYCLKLVKIMKEKNLILQIHSVNMYLDDEITINKYLDYYNEIACIYESKIKLTIHPAEESNLKESIVKTLGRLEYINNYIKKNNLNLEILLENINELFGRRRCNIYEVYEIVDNISTNITLDIGHYVYDYSNDFSKLDDKYNNKIKNIHLHDIDNKKEDHHPFYYDNVNIEKVIKYLKNIKYKDSIVLEYGLEFLKGEKFEDKIQEYINQIECINKKGEIE